MKANLILIVAVLFVVGCLSITKSYEPEKLTFRGYSLFSKTAAQAFNGTTSYTNSNGDSYHSTASVAGLSTEVQAELIQAITQGVVEGIKAGIVPPVNLNAVLPAVLPAVTPTGTP